MTHPTRRTALKAALGAAMGATVIPTSVLAQATSYPSKPVRIVVTFPPGGSSDAMLRLLTPRLNQRLGQQVLIDNKPGAGGNIGLTVVAKEAPDGYTLGLGAAGGLAANASLYPNMPFDVAKDFEPITLVSSIPFVIAGAPDLPAKTLKDVIALAKAQPGRITVGHGGNGTAMHLSAALFEQMAGVDLVQVPYRGTGPATMDALGGLVQLVVTDLPASLAHIKAGKLVPYAVTTAKRVPMLPNVPTVAEAGVPGYESVGWFGLVAPSGTPASIVSRVNAEFVAALNDEAIQNSVRTLGMEPAPTTSAQFAAYIRSETDKWARVIRQANIKLD